MVEFSSIERWPGTTPVSQALPWALAWSTILGSRTSVGWLSVNRRAGWHLDPKNEHTTACPSSGMVTSTRDGVRLVRPAGLVITVDSPMRRPHRPQGRSPLRVNSVAELQLTVPCRLLSLTRSRFQPAARPPAVAVGTACRGLPTLPQATRWTLWCQEVRHLVFGPGPQ